ncbi:MAG: hypothetical protein ACO295_05290 [Sediminibacterium sp.]
MKTIEEIAEYAWSIKEKYDKFVNTKYQGGRAYRKKFLVKEKESKPCHDCGVIYPYFMIQADHVEGLANKTLRGLSHAKNLIELKNEISKCDMVCANCHAVRTYERGVLRSISKRQPELLQTIEYSENYLT